MPVFQSLHYLLPLPRMFFPHMTTSLTSSLSSCLCTIFPFQEAKFGLLILHTAPWCQYFQPSLLCSPFSFFCSTFWRIICIYNLLVYSHCLNVSSRSGIFTFTDASQAQDQLLPHSMNSIHIYWMFESIYDFQQYDFQLIWKMPS